MQDDTIIIKLFRNGLSKGPNYSISVYDNGKVVYEGFKNVKIKDRIQKSISEEKTVLILEKLKESGLFSLNQKYSVDETSDRSFTKIVIEILGGDGQLKKKIFVHYDDDPAVPSHIKEFEDKIDETVESYKWIKKSVNGKKKTDVFIEPVLQKLVKPFPGKQTMKNKKIFKIVLPAVIAVVVVLFLVFLNMNNFLITKTEESVKEHDPPKILSLSSAKSITDDIPINSSTFGINDDIYIYFDYGNVTYNNTYDFSAVVSIYHGSNLVDSCDFDISTDEQFENYCVFKSNTSWPLGEYTVVFELENKISALSASSETSFTLYEEIPEVIVFTSASSVTAYRNYTANYTFKVGDDVFLYVEYTGINTTNDNTECDIFLNINITDYNDNVYGFHSQNKDAVGNNAHFWKFSTNSSWTSNLYNAYFYLYDYTTGLSAAKSTFFSVKS